VLSGRGLCDGPIPRPEESYRLWCVSECDQVTINNLDTCCEQVGRRGKDCEKKRHLPQQEGALEHVGTRGNTETAWCQGRATPRSPYFNAVPQNVQNGTYA
jgi:hypothetical protein